MKYKLITKMGKVYKFYTEGVAKMYQNLYGGEIITENEKSALL